jgi:hypothetical protein
VDHVENYRLPQDLAEKEEKTETLAKSGHAYEGKELAINFTLERGHDLFAPPMNEKEQLKDSNSKDEERRERKARKEQKQQQKAEKERRKRVRDRKRMEREEKDRERRARKMRRNEIEDDSVRKPKKRKKDDSIGQKLG